MILSLINFYCCCRGEREAWIKAKYSQHKFVSLETFLSKCQRLDKGIIKNLARMKVYHEQKGQAPERTNSKKSKMFRRKLALKGHKSKVDYRKSAPPNMLLSDLTSKDYENLEKLASSYLERSNDETASSDSHDEGASEGASQTGSVDGNGRPRAASVSHARSLSFDEGRDRGDSLDSTLSDNGQIAEDNGESEIDEEKSLKEDKEKAITVLKRIHPSRVSTMLVCCRVCMPW